MRRGLLVFLLLCATLGAQDTRNTPLSKDEVQQLLAGSVSSQRIVTLVGQYGIDFDPDPATLENLRGAGASEEVLASLRTTGLKQHLAKGWGSRDRGQLVAAEQEFRAALRLESGNQEAHAGLGYTLVDRADPEAAIPELRESLRLKPDDFWSHGFLGIALNQKGDREGALVEFREALRLKPESSEPHIWICSALGDKGDLDGAIGECREALRISPAHIWGHAQLGSILNRKRDFEAAAAEYREALRIQPGFADGHAGLAWVLTEKGDLDSAVAEGRQAVQLRPDNPWIHHTLAYVLERKGDLKGALEEYRAAYMIVPKNPTFSGNYERMLQQVQRISSVGQHLAQGRQYLESKAFPQAEQEFRVVLQVEANNRKAHFGLGDALQGQRRWAEATAEYLAGSPGPAVYRLRTGGAYTDSNGSAWEQDRGFDHGEPYTYSTDIKGTRDPALFQTHRSHGTCFFALCAPKPWGYQLPVANGKYRVNLYFAEIFPGVPGLLPVPSTQGVGLRVYNVSINGTAVFPNNDTFALVGGYTALVRSAEVQVTNGTLKIRFDPVVQWAMVSAVEVIAAE